MLGIFDHSPTLIRATPLPIVTHILGGKGTITHSAIYKACPVLGVFNAIIPALLLMHVIFGHFCADYRPLPDVFDLLLIGIR